MKKPLRPNRKLLSLWRHLKPEQKRQFSSLVGTSLGSMRQYVEASRRISPNVAIAIEKAAVQIAPIRWHIERWELNDTCRNCEYAIAHREKGIL